MRRLVFLFLLALISCLPFVPTAHATNPDTNQKLEALWVRANFGTEPAAEKQHLLQQLAQQADAWHQAAPNAPDALFWRAVAKALQAEMVGSGMQALALAEAAKADLEQILAQDPTGLQGNAHTILGTLYERMPGWPLGFGDSAKAQSHLQRGVELNPQNIHARYFYALFLQAHGQYAEALAQLKQAQATPPRPDHQAADEGRLRQMEPLVQKLRKKVRR